MQTNMEKLMKCNKFSNIFCVRGRRVFSLSVFDFVYFFACRLRFVFFSGRVHSLFKTENFFLVQCTEQTDKATFCQQIQIPKK